jgi:hypothetical protein
MANALGKLKTSTGPWLAAAVIVVAGFMFWLYSASSSIDSGVPSDSAMVELPRIADTIFVSNPEQFSGRRVLLSPVIISERLGRAALTVDLPGMMGYPLILDRPVLESEISVEPGDAVAIAGSVYALNDSLIALYVQRGFFTADNVERLGEQATFFLVDSLDYYFGEEEEAGEGETSTEDSGA